MLKIYTHTPSARFAYISKFLLETVLGIDFKHISHLSEFDPAQDQLLNYSNQRSSFNELYLAPHGLLSKTDIQNFDIEVKNDQSLPYFFSSHNSDWHFDIFSAAFYLLSRYEEYLPNQADAHGRFAAENSLAHRAGFLQQPLIDEWAFAFASELKKVFPTLQDDWGVYVPEVKYLSPEPLVDYKNLALVDYPNVHFVGDALSARGITVSGAQGIYVAEDLLLTK